MYYDRDCLDEAHTLFAHGIIAAAADFGISLDQVNWLGNIVALVYLPTAILIPSIISRYGIRVCVSINLLVKVWAYARNIAYNMPHSAKLEVLLLSFPHGYDMPALRSPFHLDLHMHFLS